MYGPDAPPWVWEADKNFAFCWDTPGPKEVCIRAQGITEHFHISGLDPFCVSAHPHLVFLSPVLAYL